MDNQIKQLQDKLDADRAKLGIRPQTSAPTSSGPSIAGSSKPTDWLKRIEAEGVECERCHAAVLPENQEAHNAEHQREDERSRKREESKNRAEHDRRMAVSSGDLTQWIRGVSQDHANAQVSDFRPASIAKLTEYLDKLGARGFLITGPAGTGKTRLAAALCSHLLLSEDRKVHYTMARALFRRIWQTYRDSKSGESESDLIEAFQTVDVLVIDDLGHEGKVSDAVVGALHEILSVRHDNFRLTIVTSNLSADEISRTYDSSIASRLKSWFPVVLTGKDRRETH